MTLAPLQTIRRQAGGALGALRLMLRALSAPRPATLDVAARLAALPRRAPLEHSVTIHWDAHQIPFIEAESDEDLAVALGLVHAHLRLFQMEVLRRLSQGRLAEVIGPAGVELDLALRLFDFGRAVPQIIEGLAPKTRRWAEGFLRGVNCVLADGPLPPEFALLGIPREPWTLVDLFTASRLAGADVTWIVWTRLLRARAKLSTDEWQAMWPRLLGATAPSPAKALPEVAVTAFARTGSNAAAVAGWRSVRGAAMLAADPHLSVSLPNIWLAAGFRSPGYHACGLMPAGFPIVAIGRNRHLAWGGTSLHAASSDLFDARDLPITERETVVRVRGGRARVLRLRETPLGPVVSDGVILPAPQPLALRWMGHEPSDEMGAMLEVLRADSPEAFRAALAGFGLPGQNMLHAGRDGRIGHLLAARLPRRPLAMPADIVLPPEAARTWAEPVGTMELPHWLDPPSGFVASANDRPPEGVPVPAGFFFSQPDRAQRMRELLAGNQRLSLEHLAALQQDVHASGALAVRDLLLARAGAAALRRPAGRALAAWDGNYTTDSAGALVFERMLAELAARLDGGRGVVATAVWTRRALLGEEIAAAPETRLRPALAHALRAADRALRRWRSWGEMHRMALRHHLGMVPGLRRRFSFGEWASPGGNDTLNKTSHGPARRRHTVSYGASARFLADLADDDANRVVLLGGQDGWLGSTSFTDQALLWREGRYIPLPLRPEAARAWPHRTIISPLG
jgi:penicillin amidase